jgi:hypothetical protein
MKWRAASFMVLFLALAAFPAQAQRQPWYENGPINGEYAAQQIGGYYCFGCMVSDTFYNTDWGVARSFYFGAWEWPGDVLTSVQWSITDGWFGSGHVYGQGTATGGNLSDGFLFNNQYGYEVHNIFVYLSAVPISWYRTYVLNLWNAQTSSGNPVYWDENSGIGCSSPGCPSRARAILPVQLGPNTIQTSDVPSESFIIYLNDCSERESPCSSAPESGGCR